MARLANDIGLLILGGMLGCVYAAWRQLRLEQQHDVYIDHGLEILADALNQFAIQLERYADMELVLSASRFPAQAENAKLLFRATRQMREEIGEVIPD